MKRLGRYELLRPLGKGGMGTVYEAELVGPSGFRKRVALKVLHDDAESLAREARIGALFNHPNVLSTLELGQADGTWFLAMELVDGPAVSALGRLPPGPALDVAIQACAGLAHIHGLTRNGRHLGLVHRDIKPGNLLVTTSGLIKVADFGITVPGGRDNPGGTPGYMPAEQVQGHADPRSDLFALGATLVRLVTGKRPFGGGRGAMVAVQDTELRLKAAPCMAELDDAVGGLQRLMRQCLATDPAERPPTAGELARRLRQLRSTLPSEPTLGTFCLDQLQDARSAELVLTRVSPLEVSTQAPRTNITADDLIGRDGDHERVQRALEHARLVTVVGPPGVGKTALALNVAARELPHLPGGAWFCDLSQAHDLEAVLTVIASVLGVALPEERALQGLGRVLASRDGVLLVLDNCEQVRAAAVEALAALLPAAPRLRVLATGRAPLHARGEDVQVLGPLDEAAAVALFCDRSGLTPSEDVAELVHGLDGLPLAVELAASRARFMTPRQLLDQLHDRFRLLADGPSRSLRAAIETSWALLTDDQRTGLAQLSVFVGAFELEQAAGVLDLGARGPWPLDVIGALVEHSLLECDGQRFRMLLSVRDFAGERLDPGQGEAARRRHAEALARLGSSDAIEEVYRRYDPLVHGRYRLAVDNLVAACSWAIAQQDGRLALQLGRAALVELRRTHPRRGIALLEQVETLQLTPADRASCVLSRLGAAALHHPDELQGVLTLAEEPSVQARPALWGRLQEQVGYTMLMVRDDADRALPYLAQGLQVAQAEGDTYGALRALLALGEAEIRRAAPRRALEHFQQCASTARATSSVYVLAGACSGMGRAQVQLGLHEAARQSFEKSFALFARLEHARNIGAVQAELAGLELLHGASEAAAAQARQALETLVGRVDEAMPMVQARLVLAQVAAADGQLDDAESQLHEIESLLRNQPWPRGRFEADLLWAVVDRAAGRHESANGRLEALLQSRPSPLELCEVALEAVTLALDTGEVADAAEVVARIAAGRPAFPATLEPRFLTAKACIASARNDPDAEGLTRTAEAAALLLQPGPASALGRSLARLRTVRSPHPGS